MPAKTAVQRGAVVRFTGGTGRRDETVVHTGIVNGEPYRHAGAVYVPVHVAAINRNVVVCAENILAGDSDAA
jgi:hypothetical protein